MMQQPLELFGDRGFQLRRQWLTLALLASVFLLDCWTGLGWNTPLLYTLAAWLAYSAGRESWLWMTALAASALTLLGFWLSPGDTGPAAHWWNRWLALAVVWFTAFLCYRVLRLIRHKKASRLMLEQRVEERTGQLQASEERYALAVRGSSDGLWDWNVLTDEVYYSPRFKELLGYRDEEVRNQFSEFESRLHPEDHAATLEAVRAHLEDHAPYDVEYRLRTRSGEYRWFRARGQAIWNAEGRATRMAGSITDIHERKRVETELRHERFLLETLLENLPDAIYFKDAENRFLRASLALARRLNRRSAADLIGKTDVDFFAEEYARRAAAMESEVMRSGVPLVAKEEHPVWPDGSEATVLTTKIPLRDEAGRIVGTCGISHDVTSLKLAEDAARRAQEAAEQASRAKSDFLANMSHEIRTPMNAIIGMSELVLDTELTPVQRDYLSIVLESAESLLAIINQILDFSKIEAGKLELDAQDFDLREEIGDTLKSLALRAHAKGLELAWHVHSNVPMYFRGDAVRLRQVLINLVGNAIKFTEQGEVFVDVNAAAGSDDQDVTDGELHFVVRDSGVGIPAEKMEKIFSPFEQADTSTTRAYGGTGLGLSITMRIVEAMQGRIWVESQLGAGSGFHFTIRLPRGRPPANSPPIQTPELCGVPALIVDDNALNRRILREMLENWDMSVTTVQSGPQALEAMRQLTRDLSRPPLLLTDVNMPEMDGFELVKQLRREDGMGDARIIMLTSGGRPGDAARCEELGIRCHLMKPIKQSELMDAILRILADDRQAAPPAPADEPPELPALHILLAEDGVANQRLARAMLQKWGHRVTVADNGRQAVEVWRSQDFDLILMDVQMPELDGLEATREIRELEAGSEAHIPIIALTARAMPADRQRCLAAGMDGYLSKPVRKPELYAAMAGLFATAEASPPPEDEGLAGSTASPQAEPADSGVMVNWKASLETVGGDRSLLEDVVGDCLLETPRLLEGLQAALDAGDAAEARRCAHTIKSAGRLFACPAVHQAADLVENAAQRSDLAEAARLLPDLQRLLGQLLRELQQARETQDGETTR